MQYKHSWSTHYLLCYDKELERKENKNNKFYVLNGSLENIQLTFLSAISLFVGSHSFVTVLGVMDNHFSSEDFVNELWFRGC